MIALIHFPLAIPIRLAFKPYPTDTLKGFFKCLGKDIVGVVVLAAIVFISASLLCLRLMLSAVWGWWLCPLILRPL